MHKFLSKTRRLLIDSGTVQKYLLYAVGEIALVVIGILIALQINNWNEWRKDRVKEKAVLEDLSENLTLIITILEEKIDIANESILSSNIILSVIDKKLPYSDSLGFHFQRARMEPYFSFLPQSGFENLKNLGFDILSSASLKRDVLNLFEYTFPSTNEIIENFKKPNPQWDNYISVSFHFEDSKYGPATLLPVDKQAVLNDHYYKTQIGQFQGRLEHIVMLREQCLEETKRVLKHIKQELSEE